MYQYIRQVSKIFYLSLFYFSYVSLLRGYFTSKAKLARSMYSPALVEGDICQRCHYIAKIYKIYRTEAQLWHRKPKQVERSVRDEQNNTNIRRGCHKIG